MKPSTRTADDIHRLIEQVPAEAWTAQRWFAGKGKQLSGRAVRDDVLLPGEGEALALALVDFHFAEGGGETYFVPLALARHGGGEALLAGPKAGDADLIDGLEASALGPALLKLIQEKTELPGRQGRFLFQPTRAFADIIGDAADAKLEAKVLPPLQSNSLVNYGDRALLKCMRRVRPGINADLEMTYFLTAKTDFAHIPRVAGVIEYVDEGHSHWPLAILQSFVPNEGNAWGLVVDDLKELYEKSASKGGWDADARDVVQRHGETAYRLGERTGQLHTALAADESTPDFAPEPVTTGDWAKWAGALLQEIRESFEMLRPRIEHLPADEQADCRAVLELEPRLAGMAEHLKDFPDRHPASDPPAGLFKIRYHGDYHLGQVLVIGGDFVIIDFEGEPMRPIEQRRAKQPALKDVAGMLRSFNYAGYAALFDAIPAEQRTPALDGRRALWEKDVRVAFLQGYRHEVSKARVPLVPASDEALRQLIAIFELEKALYELRYELSNRPDWVRIPLSGIRKLASREA